MRPVNKIIAVATVVMSVALIGCGSDEPVELSSDQEKEVSERLAPVGEVAKEGETAAAPAATASASAEPRSGEEVYNSKCFTCHGTGAAGAPKMGVAEDWTARIDQGMDTLYKNAIEGVRGMPPKGLCGDCSDDEMKAAVDYMVDGSK